MRKIILPLILTSFFLSACNTPISNTKKVVDFSDDTADVQQPTPTPLADPLSVAKIDLTQTMKLNQEFKVKYKTVDPAGEGYATFKATSFKPLESIDGLKPDNGKKLYLLNISVKGETKNKGQPSTFNQVGNTPSPQFVIIDKSKNLSFVEETYFSDSYTASKNLFELSKITLDGDQTVNTAIVFQIDANLTPNLAFRFTNIEGKTEFYDISE